MAPLGSWMTTIYEYVEVWKYTFTLNIHGCCFMSMIVRWESRITPLKGWSPGTTAALIDGGLSWYTKSREKRRSHTFLCTQFKLTLKVLSGLCKSVRAQSCWSLLPELSFSCAAEELWRLYNMDDDDDDDKDGDLHLDFCPLFSLDSRGVQVLSVWLCIY